MPESPSRLAAVLGALASSADLANGFPLGKVLRTAILSAELARHAGLDDGIIADAYFLAQLRYLGCTGFAHEEAHHYGAGDDVSVRNTMVLADAAAKGETLGRILRGIAPGASLVSRGGAIWRLVTGDAVTRHAHATCNAAARLARHFAMPEPLVAALGTLCERWDGLGAPHGLAADAIPLAMRVFHVADLVEVAHHRGGPDAAHALVARRRDRQIDPALADRFLASSARLCATLETTTLWEDFLAAEPAPARAIAPAQIDEACRALGFFADLKSVFLLGHSQKVAALAHATATALGLPPDEITRCTRAAHLHDLGRVAIPSGTWDRKGPLGALEWEQVRMHTYHTDRVLALAPTFAELRPIAASAHERAPGDGYHRGLGAAQLPPAARVLAVADQIVAMGEERPHRAAHTPAQIGDQLAADVAKRRHDARVVDAALACAGIAARSATASALPHGLSEREREVLCWVARGKTNKEIAIVLGISPKTVQHHVAHVYDKIGVYSRAGAAIFAMEHRLV